MSAAGHRTNPGSGSLTFWSSLLPCSTDPAPSARYRLRRLRQFACAGHAALTRPPTALVLAVATFPRRSVAGLSAEEYFVPALAMPVGSRVQKPWSDPRSHLLRVQTMLTAKCATSCRSADIGIRSITPRSGLCRCPPPRELGWQRRRRHNQSASRKARSESEGRKRPALLTTVLSARGPAL